MMAAMSLKWPVRIVCALAVGCYLTGLGCTLLQNSSAGTGDGPGDGEPSATTAQSPSTSATPVVGAGPGRAGFPYRAAAMQLQRVDWTDQYAQSIDECAAVGFDTVELIVDTRQEDGMSNRIYLDGRMTPSPEMLATLIRHAKAKGLRVILMPIVLLDDPKGDEWRGTLTPQSWAKWFDSYRDMLNHFAWVAQGNGVDIFVVGSELVSSEKHPDEWRKTIDSVRKVFKGKLTYSANWDVFASVPFWDQLDLIGMNSYWKLGPDENVTVDQIKARWREIQANVLPFVKKSGKPLLFTEIGWCSLANAAKEPWDYTKTEVPVDDGLQKRLYEGFFQCWYGNPNLGGFGVWEWTPGDGGPKDRGYTPENKPAEQVLKDYLAKPAWKVK